MHGATVIMSADDGSLPGRKEDYEAIVQYRQLFELHNYYEGIKAFTFETIFLPLSVEEVRAWRSYNMGTKMTEEANAMFEGLQNKLQLAIQTFTKRGNKCFVRLSTRSPKDAVDKIPERILPLLEKELDSLSQPPLNLDGNSRLLALRRAFFACMQVESAKEVFDLIMYSSRAVSDIKRALDFIDMSSWSLNLIIREFVDMPIQGELRGFVHKGQLNALSQYYADCYFEVRNELLARLTMQDLVRSKDKVAAAVRDFFQEVQPHIHLESYICDFVVLQDNSVRIVELNPFSESTGSCLFDWKADKEVIENGPFEFRVATSPVSYVESLLMPFNHLLDQASKNLQERRQIEARRILLRNLIFLSCVVAIIVRSAW